MARTAVTLGFTAVGAAAGAYFGNPMMGAQIGMMVGSIASALLFPPEGQQGPRLGDLRVADASYGTPIPIVYGTARLAGTMMWTSGIEERATEESMKGGGPTSTTYAYFSSFAVGLCEGPLESVRKIWLDTKLVYDASGNNTGIMQQRIGAMDPRHLLTGDELADRREEIEAEINAVNSAMVIYLGTETQLPDPTMEAHEGAGQVPAHRGMAYLVFQDLPLMYYGNRIPNISAEVQTQSAPSYPRKTVAPTTNINVDQMIYDAPRQLVYNRHLDNITAIDALNMTLLHSGPVETSANSVPGLGPYLGLCLAVDQDGFLYTTLNGSGGGPNGARLGRIDPVAWTVTHINRHPTTGFFEDLGPASTLIVSPHFVWFCAYFYGSLAHCFTRPGALNPQTGEPVPEMLRTATIEYAILPTAVSGYYGTDICIDRDETAWIVCTRYWAATFVQTYLVHFEPTGGAQVFDISADLANGAWMAYDAQTHALVIEGTPPDNVSVRRIVRYDIEAGEVTDVSADFTSHSYIKSSFRQGVQGRQIWWAGGIHSASAFDVDTMTITRDIDITANWPISGTSYSGMYDVTTNAFLVTENGAGLAKYYFDRLEAQPVALGTIVQDLSRRAGLAPADVQTGALSDPVHGFVHSQQGEARASLEALLGAYLADGVETDWVLRFQHRALAPVAILTAADLGAHEAGSDPVDLYTPERLDDQTLPMRVDVTYPDPARDYQDNVQHARRFQAGQHARSQRQLRVPVVVTATQAKQLAEQSLSEAWVSRTSYRLTLPYRWTTCDPGDVLSVSVADQTLLMRIQRIANGANGLLEVEAVAYDREIYTASPAIAVIPDAPPPQLLTMEAPTGLFLLDTHLFRDIDEGAGFYLGMTPQGGGSWPGATAFSSLDGASWRQEATLTAAVEWGSSVQALAPGSPFVIDTGHTVDIRMARGALTSVPVDALLNGANAALLGQEIVQWQDATPLDANTWRLANLLRGRRGTEWAIPTHQPGDRFVVLSPRPLRRAEMGLDEVGITQVYRGVTLNTDALTAAAQSFKNTALGLKCYSPDHVHGTRTVSHDLTITWARRTRLGGLWIDGRDVLLGETTEAYEVDVVSGGTVRRTLTTSTPSVLYTATQQSSDGLTPGVPVTVTVYQMGVLGRGWGTTATI